MTWARFSSAMPTELLSSSRIKWFHTEFSARIGRGNRQLISAMEYARRELQHELGEVDQNLAE
jgi:hypothetical protein